MPLPQRFEQRQIQLLEKLNRADVRHLPQLRCLVLPDRWDLDDLAYSPLPNRYEWAAPAAKAVVVHLPSQVFGAYAYGELVRWGPISSGYAAAPTPSGLFNLTWKSTGRYSTVNPRWYMPWYFNFANRRGLAFHAYALPGKPASHACIRLLERDAQWLYHWGEQWRLDASGAVLIMAGTPVLVVGQYDYHALPPWQQGDILSGKTILILPADPSTHWPATNITQNHGSLSGSISAPYSR